MRELKPGAIRSRGREAWREFYASYIKSPAWWQRRHRWLEEELELERPRPLQCLGGCGKDWKLTRDDLHHCSYDRLGNEAHDDLWPLCRTCHSLLHELLDSTRSWRKLPYTLANQHALAVVQDRRSPTTSPAQNRVASLRDFL